MHIVNECPQTKFPGGLQTLHSASEDSITLPHKLSNHAIEPIVLRAKKYSP